MHKNKINNNPVKEYTYDACGKLIQVEAPHQQITQSQWDYEDRLIGVTYPNQSTNSFGYNPFGARVSKSDSTGNYTFLRSGTSVVAPVLDDGSATYTPGISERRNNNSTYYHSDLKNATTQTNSSESVSGTNQYDAFGNLVNYTGNWNGPFSYGGAFGYQTDDDSGLMLLGHRYYDSSTGRFLSRDPVGDGLNWYAYCLNNPIKYSDRNGLEPRPSAAPLETPWLDDGLAVSVGSRRSGWQAFLDGAYDFAVGWGDGVSFGATGLIRNWLGIPSYVDEGSIAYGIGKFGGNVNGSYLIGGGAGRLWNAVTGGRPLKIPPGGAHVVRIEASRSVHLIPGIAKTAIPHVLHFHIVRFGLNHLHLPYQLWPLALYFYWNYITSQNDNDVDKQSLIEPEY